MKGLWCLASCTFLSGAVLDCSKGPQVRRASMRAGERKNSWWGHLSPLNLDKGASGRPSLPPFQTEYRCVCLQTSINVEGFRSLREGEPVEYDLDVSEDGRAKAMNVTGPKGQPPLVCTSQDLIKHAFISLNSLKYMWYQAGVSLARRVGKFAKCAVQLAIDLQIAKHSSPLLLMTWPGVGAGHYRDGNVQDMPCTQSSVQPFAAKEGIIWVVISKCFVSTEIEISITSTLLYSSKNKRNFILSVCLTMQRAYWR